MNKKIKVAIVAAFLFSSAFLFCGAVFADGADPKTVTPAWVIEKEYEEQQAQPKEGAQTQPEAQTKPAPAKSQNLLFLGYDYPILSGPLASSLSTWDSPFNFSIGIEDFNQEASPFLTGLELEFFITVHDSGLRLQMNDMVMFGYSIPLAKVAQLNLGARLGLSLLDVTDNVSPTNSYFALGGIAGPEASIYAKIAPSFWLWVRGRYSMAYFMAIESSGSSPIDTGTDSLNCISLEAGLAFRI